MDTVMTKNDFLIMEIGFHMLVFFCFGPESPLRGKTVAHAITATSSSGNNPH